MTFKQRLNHQIRSLEVRVTHGPVLGVMSHSAAMEVAGEHGLDLIEIAGGASPPACIIADLGKWKYEQAKRAKATKQPVYETKTVQMRPVTEEHDRVVKANQTRKFLGEGHRVMLVVKFRGRELAHPDEGLAVLRDIIDRCVVEGVLEVGPAKLEGRQISCILAPRRG